MATCSARKSVILPLPSSPHWSPTITVAGTTTAPPTRDERPLGWAAPNPHERPLGGLDQGGVEHENERTPRCVSERAEPTTPSWAAPAGASNKKGPDHLGPG